MVVALNDCNRTVNDCLHDADMFRVARAVALAAVVPVVEDDVAGLRDVAVILFPASHFLKQRNHPRTGTLTRDDVGKPRLNGGGANRRGAPRVFVRHGVVARQVLHGVVGVDNPLVDSTALFSSKPAAQSINEMFTKFLFRHFCLSSLLI